ncbi:MAG: pyridoxal phosphate-dependent aminotransferase [Klebsiella michiganensis]|nr:pyridoxal phosphate-dependent aminotransferase [Klebsiella michiganensis]
MNNSQIARRMQSVRPSPTAAISDQVRVLEAAGKQVINLGEGELDFATPPHISYAGIEAIVHHQTKYTAVSGTAALKAAIAAKFARDNQLRYRPEEIIAGSGAKQLIFNAFLATLDAGQQVIIPAPYWVSYPDMVSLADGEPVIVPCDEQHGWKLTPEQLAAALTPSTRWLILNSPGNPTGAIYSERELRALADVLADYPQVLVMADDIYEPLRYDNTPFTTFARPQWLIAAMQILQSQSTSNPSAISQAAAVAALNHSADFLDGWLHTLDKRRQQVLGMIAATEGLSAGIPQGAFYVFANCQRLIGRVTPTGETLRDDSGLANWLLEHTQVAVLHGSAFGMPGYLRIAYAVEDGLLTQACQRIAEACAQLR